MAKLRVHLLEGGQQPLAPLAVQAGDAGAQLGDRLFQIGLFRDQRVMLVLRPSRASSSARRFTAPSASRWRFSRFDLDLDRLGAGHRRRVGSRDCSSSAAGVVSRSSPIRASADATASARRLGPRLGRAPAPRAPRRPGARPRARRPRRRAARPRPPTAHPPPPPAAPRPSLIASARSSRFAGEPAGTVARLVQLGLADLARRSASSASRRPAVSSRAAPAGQLPRHRLAPPRPRLALAPQLVMRRRAGSAWSPAPPRPSSSPPRPRARATARSGSVGQIAASASASRSRAPPGSRPRAAPPPAWQTSTLPPAMLRSASARLSPRVASVSARSACAPRLARPRVRLGQIRQPRASAPHAPAPRPRPAPAPPRVRASAPRAGSTAAAAAPPPRAHPPPRRETRPSATDRPRG